MTVVATAVRWVDVLADLEAHLAEGERLVAQGDLEEFRALPVPVVAAELPAELVDRARALQERMAALAELVAESMVANRRDHELAGQDRHSRTDRPVRRQWHPSYVDARA